MKKTPAKVQNDQYKTVRGVALTRHPGQMLMDRWTDGRRDGLKNERKLACLSHPC